MAPCSRVKIASFVISEPQGQSATGSQISLTALLFSCKSRVFRANESIILTYLQKNLEIKARIIVDDTSTKSHGQHTTDATEIGEGIIS
jgi:hypothetical protein